MLIYKDPRAIVKANFFRDLYTTSRTMSDYYGSSSGHRDGFGLFLAGAWNQTTVSEESKVEEFEVVPAESAAWNDSEFEAVPVESAVWNHSDYDEENEIVFSAAEILNVSMESESFYPSPSKNGEEAPSNPPKKKASRKDDDEHGRLLKTEEWGQISRKELLVVLFLLISIVVVAITVVVVFVVGGGDAGTTISDAMKSDPPTTPTDEYVQLGSQEKLDILRSLIARNEVAAEYLDILPEFAVALEGKLVDDTAEAIVRAASWVVHEDQLNIPEQIVSRFALATIFFANSGDSWTNSNGWLSNESICDGWYGISCYFTSEKIEEIDLSSNNLQGEIPEVLTLLTDVRVLWLNDNQLMGRIPGESIGSMPLLVILYMQGNQLTGPIPTAVKNNGVLRKSLRYIGWLFPHLLSLLFLTQSIFSFPDTLFLQRNNLTGSWPEAFCPPCPGCDRPFNEFGLDCSEVSCSPECCKSVENCY
jgi:hypothetical protein